MEQVKAYCEQWDMLPAGALVLCAVSGGRDSMAMLHLLRALAQDGGFTVAAAHFNHHLRPEADREESFVRNWCREQNIPCYVGGSDVAADAKLTGRSLEDAARQARYGFLQELADRLGAARIATAHHRQDNAETILLNLTRGTGLQGLTGIPPVRGNIVRPLLEVDRSAIDRYVARHGIPYVEDASNADPHYARRNRLRLEVLPLLEEISGGCTERMTRTAAILRQDNDHLQREAAKLLPPEEEEGTVSLAVTVLQKQDRAVASRLVRMMASRLGLELTAAQTEAVLAMKSGTCLDLGRENQAIRKAHRLTICRKKLLPPSQKLGMGWQSWGDYGVDVSEEAPANGRQTAVLPAWVLDGELAIGAWDGTGRMAVETGSRTIKRLFADRGIPVEKRETYPALYLDGRIIAVPGVAVDQNMIPREGERTVYVRIETLEKE